MDPFGLRLWELSVMELRGLRQVLQEREADGEIEIIR